jgi:hypothetical protein
MLRRNQEAGEEVFADLMLRYPRDGILFFERGKARADVGDLTGALDDLKKAETYFPRSEFKAQARRALEGLTRPGRPDAPAVSGLQLAHVPTLQELQHAHDEFVRRERRAVDFDVAARRSRSRGCFKRSPK